MAFANVDIGNSPADGTGDPLRTAFSKINQNFANISTGLVPINAPVRSVAGRIGNVTITVNDIIGGISKSATQALVTAANSAAVNYTDQSINNLINGAPLVLDTLGEIAANLAAGSGATASIIHSLASTNANVLAANASISAINTAWQANAATQHTDILGANAAIVTANVSLKNYFDDQLAANTSMVLTYSDALNSVMLANITATNLEITSLYSNAAVQSINIDSINANITAANLAISALQSNAAIQATILDVLTSNAATQSQALDTLTSNAAVQSDTLTELLGNAVTQQSELFTLTSNAASQADELISLLSNTTALNQAFSTIDANIGVLVTDIKTLDANLGTVNTTVAGIDANIGVLVTDIQTLDANVGQITLDINTIDANVGVLVTDISTLDANVGVLVTDIQTLDSNVGVLVTDIQTLDSNVGQITLDLDTINANITAANTAIVDLETAGYITAATANVISVNGQTGVVEITIPSPYTDANVTTYLPTYTGSLSPTLLTVSGDASVTGVLNISTITEKFVSNSVPGTVTDIDWAGAGIHYLTNLTANITANLQNVAIASGTVSSLTIWISQGGTAYVPTAMNINNTPQTINWAGSTVAPGGTANKQDLVSFTIMNTAGTYNVLAQLSSYG